MLSYMPFRFVVTCVLALVWQAVRCCLNAQQAAADVPAITIRTNTRLVVVDVVVTHKNGMPFADLKPEDFTLEENGKKQKISVFVPPGIVNRTVSVAPSGVLSNHPENVVASGVPNRAFAGCDELRF